MPTGVVKFFNTEKGYGFLVPLEAGPDVFVHARAVQDANLIFLNEGDRLEYDLAPGRDGRPQASNLRRVP